MLLPKKRRAEPLPSAHLETNTGRHEIGTLEGLVVPACFSVLQLWPKFIEQLWEAHSPRWSAFAMLQHELINATHNMSMKAKFSESLVHIYGIESQEAFHEFHVSNTASLRHFVCSLCMGIVGTLAALLAQNRSRLEAADPVQLSGFTELCMLGPPCSGPSTPMKWAAKGVRFGRPGGTPNQLMAGTSGWLALQRFQTTAAILLLSVAFVHSIISVWGRLKYYFYGLEVDGTTPKC